MIRKLPVLATLIISLTMAGCSAGKESPIVTGSEDKGEEASVVEIVEEPSVGMANPWREITAEEASQNPRMFKAPDNATNIVWQVLDSAADEKTGAGPLVELDFDIEDEYGATSFCARYQYGVDESEDISGMYYDWTVTDEGTLPNWGMGNMKAKFYGFNGEDEMADLCTWYDIEIGISYSLSTSAPDLDGFDIQSVVEAMYPGDEIYSDGSE
ncbi:MAG: hypothetical protein IK111_08700 [Lachnospiraceae bacterium]|nr:hypothetical protein [Lachnospiraceae bacterium]